MSMFYATVSIIQLWDSFLQDNAKGRNGNFIVTDYHVIRAVSPYYMLHPTKPSAWFVTWPGTAGKDNPSGMSRSITGTLLCLEDSSVCTYTHALESTSTIASLGCLSYAKVATPSTIPTITSLLVTPSLALKILSPPSLPFQTITSPKRVSIFLFSPTLLIR
jgi:hypothetical protein